MDGAEYSKVVNIYEEGTTMVSFESQTCCPKVGEEPSTAPTSNMTSEKAVVVTQHDARAIEVEGDSKEGDMIDQDIRESPSESEMMGVNEKEVEENDVPTSATPVIISTEKNITMIEQLAIDTMTRKDAHCEGDGTVDDAPRWRQASGAGGASLKVLSLPFDALHCVASFLTAADWAHFGQTTTIATPICRDVFHRVRMHGFRCATEVVIAWKLGHRADARELSALYIQSGVPIYPSSLGHSYHTLVWRMGLEAQEMELNEVRASNNNPSREHEGEEEATRLVDPFFAERYEAHVRENDGAFGATYLEEKCFFHYNKAAETDSRLGRRVSMTSRSMFAPPAPVLGLGMNGVGAWDGRTRLPGFRPAGPANTPLPESRAFSPTRSLPPTSTGSGGLVYQDASRIPPKVKVSLHRHLADQHLLGRRTVDDENGAMVASPISLAADFYHQNVRVDQALSGPFELNSFDEDVTMRDGYMIRQDVTGTVGGAAYVMRPGHPMDLEPNSRFQGARALVMTPLVAGTLSPSEGGVMGVSHQTPLSEVGRFVDSQLGHNELEPPDFGSEHSIDESSSPSYETPLQPSSLSVLSSSPPPPPVPTPDELSSNDVPIQSEPSILSCVNLDIYSSTSARGKSVADIRDGTSELMNHLKIRFDVYQRRLETLLSQIDSPGFEECLLDFWDEFLPCTSNVHFHDRNTAVPRISGLQEFLSKPCPKAFGVVQCEIERIKINSKRKGVKGRLFPTYEYRLFIRDKRHDSNVEITSVAKPVRSDTVLMMAKNRGRKYQASAGVVPAPCSSKKGVNNYYLYMPQQVDVDTHYRVVNGIDGAELISNGASSALPTRQGDDKAPVLLGRLQSNFIGTEFQIFTPTLQKHPVGNGRKPAVAKSSNILSSDSESDYEVLSDSPTSYRRKNRFRRKSNPHFFSSNSSAYLDGSDRRPPQPIEEEECMGHSSDRRKNKRSYSLPNFRRSTRSSRRAVANANDSPTASQQAQNMFYEEEDGAITYTANLLGNRPRIMDVCVPRVSSEGVPGADWKRYLGSLGDSVEGANTMLNHFKQVQQRLENPDPSLTDQAENGYNPHGDFGLLALQNRPPWWNVELGAFVLNFGGRVSVASVKNFQLCDRNDQDHVMLQFGRIQGRHSFTMDFQYPLTAVQAFAIAISSLQSRISFG